MCGALDAKPSPPRGAASGSPGPGGERERGSEPGRAVYGDSREGRDSQGVGLSELEGGSEGLEYQERG